MMLGYEATSVKKAQNAEWLARLIRQLHLFGGSCCFLKKMVILEGIEGGGGQ
jgi:hypothetical protein